MRLSKFSIENYKCFTDPTPLRLLPGFNVVVGPNNVGKTALLEALALSFPGRPHRSLQTLPRATKPLRPDSKATFSISVSMEELLDVLPLKEIALPIPKGYQPNVDDAHRFLDELLKRVEVELILGRRAERDKGSFIQQRFPTLESIKGTGSEGQRSFFIYRLDADTGQFKFHAISTLPDDRDSLFQAALRLVTRTYAFRAERFSLGETAFGANAALASDASNLAEVIHVLQTTKPARFDDLLRLVREVFPAIAHLSVRPKIEVGGRQEIIVWNERAATGRADLAFTLGESGTGIGQVLAILYVALNADHPLTIIIDEPNSFLHPGASRKLIQILHDFPQHQYLLSTHSPEIIRAANPSTLILLNRDGPNTSIRQVDAANLESQQQALQSLGVRLSDVFGADSVLWVEGATEEVSFPLILRAAAQPQLHSVISILAVRSASEFQGKRKRLELVLEVYRRLTASGALVPRTLGFIFDSEGLSEADRASLIATSRNLMRFLPRRMFENYLIHPESIAAVLSQRPSFAAAKIETTAIEKWMRSNGTDPKFFGGRQTQDAVLSERWIRSVDGADLLDALFADLSGQKERYEKISDGAALTAEILRRAPSHFEELHTFLRECAENNS